MTQATLTPDQIRQERIRRERDWYLSDEGFLDFARDSGACPDAEYEPHGKYCLDVIKWHERIDPAKPDRVLYKAKLVLWPRGSFKSQLYGVAYCAWRIAKNPNIRIAYASATSRQAEKFVENIKDIVDSAWYRECFGTHRGEDWRNGVFTSALRTATHLKDPTLQAFGVGETQTGAHWDLGLIDDVVDQKNTATPLGIEKTRTWFGELKAQIDPGSHLLILGTLHHFADLYCWIQKDDAIRALFDVSVFAWRDPPGDPDDGVEGKLFFPNRLTTDFVREQKAFLSKRLFACFYNNSPHAGDEQLFLVPYFRVVKDELIPKSVWGYIFTDFAFIDAKKQKEEGSDPDRTCFWVVMLDPNRTAYVLDVHVGRWKLSDSARLLCELWNHYCEIGREMKGVCIEVGAHEAAIQSAIEEVRRQTFIRPRIIQVRGRSQSTKPLRIEGIEPRFRRGDIYFAESFRQKPKRWRDMISEMTEYPYSGHDDVPDAIADLDQKDQDGRFYCPAPKPGWRPQEAQPYRPPMVDGRMSRTYAPDPREVIRRDQQHSSGWPFKAADQKPDNFWKKHA